MARKKAPAKKGGGGAKKAAAKEKAAPAKKKAAPAKKKAAPAKRKAAPAKKKAAKAPAARRTTREAAPGEGKRPPARAERTPLPATAASFEDEPPPPRGLRVDLHAYNDSPALVIASRSALGRGAEPWDGLVLEEGTLLPVDLGFDAPIELRVVVGGALEPPEAEEWVGRVVTRLSIPDGKLVVVGGTQLIIEERDPASIADEGDVRVLDVPPGDYRAELLVYPTAPFGPQLLARTGNEPLGAWWRRTRAGQAMPAWVRARCLEDPAKHDPGHEGEWAHEREPRRALDLVELLLHLSGRWGDEDPPPLEDGFVPADGFAARRPGRCPVGLEQRDPVGKRPRPAEDEEPAPRHLAPPIHERVQGLPLKLVPGGAVRVPADRIARVARLAWFSHAGSHPELRLEPGPGGELPDWEPAPGMEATREGEALRIALELPGGGNPHAWELGTRGWLDLAGERIKALPDGTVLELAASDASGGVLRCRGPVRAGSWELVSTYPAVGRDTLEGVLALSAEVDGGDTLAVEPDEADDLMDWARGEGEWLLDGNALSTREGVVGLRERDSTLLGIAARRLFRRRFADAWPMDEDEE